MNRILKPLTRSVSILLSVTLLLFTASSGASAAAFLTYGWPKSGTVTTVPYRPYSYNTTWQLAMTAGQTAWNNSAARVLFSASSTSSNTVIAAQYTWADYGVNTIYHSGSKATKFEIQLNSLTISKGATNISTFIASVYAHELGHSIWLGDNPNQGSPATSLMNYGRDRNVLARPLTIDITNVNTKY